jgi:predicted 3-demethylubiquinone-9 3-methyltransferase (glyoxalase superfamily)
MQKIIPNIWMNNQGEDAAKFYTSTFKDSKINNIMRYGKSGAEVSGRKEGSVMTVDFQIRNYRFTIINGGPIFKPNPSISFIVMLKTPEATEGLFKRLSKNGKVMMGLDKYPFSEKYAFLEDKYGVSWQLFLDLKAEEKIIPAFLFVGKNLGKAEAAEKHYVKIFKKAKINNIMKYPANDPSGNKKGTVMYSSFILEGQEFGIMDGAGEHKFQFTEGVSLLVSCKDQKEVDYYWKKLLQGGQESQCGWLKDKFGVSWQVFPEKVMGDLMKKYPNKAEQIMNAMFHMKKIDVRELEKVGKGE